MKEQKWNAKLYLAIALPSSKDNAARLVKTPVSSLSVSPGTEHKYVILSLYLKNCSHRTKKVKKQQQVREKLKLPCKSSPGRHQDQDSHRQQALEEPF